MRQAPTSARILWSTVLMLLTRYVSDSKFTFTEAEVTVSPEVRARVFELSREIGRMIHDEALPAGTPDSIRISATLALFEVAKPDTVAHP